LSGDFAEEIMMFQRRNGGIRDESNGKTRKEDLFEKVIQNFSPVRRKLNDALNRKIREFRGSGRRSLDPEGKV